MLTADLVVGWDWRLFGLWVLVNAASFAVIPFAGAELDQLNLRPAPPPGIGSAPPGTSAP